MGTRRNVSLRQPNAQVGDGTGDQLAVDVVPGAAADAITRPNLEQGTICTATTNRKVLMHRKARNCFDWPSASLDVANSLTVR
jgi:hypothetical protein